LLRDTSRTSSSARTPIQTIANEIHHGRFFNRLLPEARDRRGLDLPAELAGLGLAAQHVLRHPLDGAGPAPIAPRARRAHQRPPSRGHAQRQRAPAEVVLAPEREQRVPRAPSRRDDAALEPEAQLPVALLDL